MSFPYKRVLVTGGYGFLGSYVWDRLESYGVDVRVFPSTICDLTDSRQAENCFAKAEPDLVIHLAARVGGIGANRENPATYFDKNLRMGMNVIHQSWAFGVKKLVVVGTTCSYPRDCAVPFREEDLFTGYPEATNAPYGVAKLALLTMCQAYREQYGLNAVYLIPANLYGPRDNFNPDTSHVIPAMIRKMVMAREGGQDSVRLFGTGNPTRDFLYADECARAILLAAEHYDGAEPVNVGTGNETSIRSLSYSIKHLTGFLGDIVWDEGRPDGQPRRCLDVTRAWERFGFRAETRLNDGLRKTVAWYEGRA